MIRNPFARTLTRLSLVCLFPPRALDRIADRGRGRSGPSLLADIGIAVETVAPVLILAETRDREAALVLAGVCAASAALRHPFWAYDDLMAGDGSQGREHLWEFLKNLGLAGGLMTIVLDGPPKRPKPAPPVVAKRPPAAPRPPAPPAKRYTAFR